MAKTAAKTIMSEDDISRAVKKIAGEIVSRNKGAKNLALIGVLDGGYPLAKRIASIIETNEEEKVPVGGIDVSFYRDDLSIRGKSITPKKSDILFSIDKKTVVLVDDVLFHGRTVRAALDSLNDYGRPARVQLAVLVDRGNRELPIQPDYCGKKITTTQEDDVKVHLAENEGIDQVTVK